MYLLLSAQGAYQRSILPGPVGYSDWQDYPVVDGRAIGLLFNDDELVWLRSAWESAIKGP